MQVIYSETSVIAIDCLNVDLTGFSLISKRETALFDMPYSFKY